VTEILIRYAKLLAVFALFWAGLWVYNTRGCRRVEGAEMEPTLGKEKARLISPGVFKPDDLAPGDLVSFNYVQGTRGQRTVAARVIGLPGDKVRIEKGEVFVNGGKVGSEYVSAPNRTLDDYAEIVVPRDSVFVLCDNRKLGLSLDSRAVGPVSTWAILGRF
jgi:signal peptidase I